ncbi:hypothetical protein COB52_04575 [Candidatus Kaiserbacteria bacterium]|nr:MAG: hypothetical protein COB52_04575 [Candidatus Kaiserbacteria bacterium]
MFSLQLSNKVAFVFFISLLFAFFVPFIASADGEGGNGGNGGGSFCCGATSSLGKAAAAIGDAIGSAFSGGGSLGKATGKGIAMGLTTADLNAANEVTNPSGDVVGKNSFGQSVYSGSGGGLETFGADGVGPGGPGDGPGGPQVTGGSCAVSSCPSPINACGFSGTGNKCTGGPGSHACTATIPALPAYLGTACSESFSETICGESVTRTAFGSKNCSNTCVISVTGFPPVVSNNICNLSACPSGTSGTYPDCGTCPSGFSGQYPSCAIVTPPALGDTDISLKAKPSLVGKDQSTTITWASVESTSCSITGTNGDSWSGRSGRVDSSPITEKTVFTLSCTDSGGETIKDVETVYISPAWQEI